MRKRSNTNETGPGAPGSWYKPLSGGEVGRVVEEAFRVLQRSGMLVHSARAREAFRKAGAEVGESERVVRLPRSLVEDAVASNPSSITLHSRDGSCDAVLEDSRVHFGTGGTAIYVLDPDSGERRPSTVEDIVLCARLTQALENIHVFTINVFPNELSEGQAIDVNRFFHSLDNTAKHVMGGIYSMEGCLKVIEMAEAIAGSPEALRERPFISFITLIISPFKIDGLYGDMTCAIAERGLPVVVPTEPICGTTSPVTLASNVLTHVAETLGGIALVQSVRKGAPGICGSVGSITNLRTMDHVGGAIERAMINAAVAQVAQHLELPLYSTGGTTDAKVVDVQSAYESGMSSLLVAMSGANYIHDIAGLMEADLTVSFDKMVVDNEILGMCRRVLRGIEVNDDTLAADLLIDKGPGKDYLDSEHTVRYMRSEFYEPGISNRQKRDGDYRGQDALPRAREVVEGLRASAPRSMLEPGLRAELLERYPAIRRPGG
jgi:trimethylamine--corrinoid protein Co-methyltransferase